jgi:hypothetical protein
MPPSLPSSASSLSLIPEANDYHDDEISSLDMNQTHLVPDLAQHYHSSGRHSGNGHASQFIADAESGPRRMRPRPTQEQTDELKRMYDIEPHPSTDLRQALSERLGM